MKKIKFIAVLVSIAAATLLVSCGQSEKDKAAEKAKAENDQKSADSNLDSLAASMGGDGNEAKIGPADTTKKVVKDKKK
ncbi:MAG: hypothetical protein WCL14_13695 [Bacteroidota bacterium]